MEELCFEKEHLEKKAGACLGRRSQIKGRRAKGRLFWKGRWCGDEHGFWSSVIFSLTFLAAAPWVSSLLDPSLYLISKMGMMFVVCKYAMAFE